MSENDLGLLGFVGAGHLAAAMLDSWINTRRENTCVAVWSRNRHHSARHSVFSHRNVNWKESWRDLLIAGTIIIAIPGEVFAALALNDSRLPSHRYTGRVISAATSLRFSELQKIFPNAKCVRISPFLLPGVNGISTLVLRDSNWPDDEWKEIHGLIASFGAVDTVTDEYNFECLTLLGSPLSTAVMHGVAKGFEALITGWNLGVADAETARRILWRALCSLAASAESGELETVTKRIASPGGLTDQGLSVAPDFVSLLGIMEHKMASRREEMIGNTLHFARSHI
uniref:Pyrroline-5-carboxylate reductase n=1 Tax=Candidatus Kentrum sp. TC TaxID=2126339 RepID=A0A451A1P2_9GAMM|nr:MAG: Pyrroline-5-carboxylate reductase [Candidatus Kentron sp. TC]